MYNMTTNELIITLSHMNTKLNPENKENNIKSVFAGVEDERDSIINKILFDGISEKHVKKEYVCDFYLIQIKEMNRYYKIYNNNIDFTFIVEKIIRILMKNYKLYSNVKSPKGHLISYLFLKGINGFPNRIWSMFQSYMYEFEEMQGYQSVEKYIEKTEFSLDESEKEFYKSCSDAFDMEVYLSGMNEHIDNAEKISKKELLEEEKTWYKEDNIKVESESKSTTKNNTISIFNVNAEQLRMKNKYILLDDKDFNDKLDELKQAQFKKWHKYRDETGFLPHDISKYHEGWKYIPVREKVKNPDYIEVYCAPKKFDFSYIFFDKKVEIYLKNVIIKKLSKRQQLLIGYLYYEMVPVDKIIISMSYINKTALDKEKHRALKKIKLQMINDYDFIQREYGETYLEYWVKKIKKRYDEFAKKEQKKLSI